MSPVSSLPAIIVLLAAVAASSLLVRRFGSPSEQGRYASIDGLRGYLALFVFLHHSCIWYFYLRTGHWKDSPSNLYTHFGQSSVALFFMITGFLFFRKLLDGRTKRIDWGRLFISRLLRLVPLYLFTMFLLFCIVAYASHGVLNEPIPKLLKEVVQWLGFTIFGAPNLNGIGYTSTIIAGVTWSLPYEWFFYCSLPLIALTVRVIPPWPYLALGTIASIIGLTLWHQQMHHLTSFLSGIITGFLVQSSPFRQFAVKTFSSFILMGCITIAIIFYPSAYKTIPLFLLSVAFALIACGNNLLGLLVSPISRTLGEMAYSIYLLHGITLFVTFNFILSADESKALSPITHWLLVVGITPILVFICFFTFRWIENPAMRSTTIFTVWLRSHLPHQGYVKVPPISRQDEV